MKSRSIFCDLELTLYSDLIEQIRDSMTASKEFYHEGTLSHIPRRSAVQLSSMQQASIGGAHDLDQVQYLTFTDLELIDRIKPASQ